MSKKILSIYSDDKIPDLCVFAEKLNAKLWRFEICFEFFFFNDFRGF